MNVYIVNMKDNRYNHNKNDDTKFLTCISNQIIAIGWGSNASRTQSNYKAAINKFRDMKKGDYIWTKNPKNKNKFYLLEIVDNEGFDYLEAEKDYYIDDDISFARKIKIIDEFSAENLPKGISKTDIIARHTAEKVHKEFFINATLSYAEKFKEKRI